MSKDRCFVIAEIGVNHNGNLDLAKRSIVTAIESGADAVKFQVAVPELVVASDCDLAPYQAKAGMWLTQLEMLKGLHLSMPDYEALAYFCSNEGITWGVSVFDEESASKIKGWEHRFLKIASGEITNLPLLRKLQKPDAAKSKFPSLIVSTGMSVVEEISTAVAVLFEQGFDLDDLVLLHCVSQYPAPLQDSNLMSIRYLQDYFKCKVGFSDHSSGKALIDLVVGLGGCVIEKHFTLDRNMVGPDHGSSLDPETFKSFVERVREVSSFLGTYSKDVALAESQNKNVVRRGIYAKVPIEPGEQFTEANMITMRPVGKAVPAQFWDELVGRHSSKRYSAGMPILAAEEFE